jgi:hypothetical protein
MSAIRVARSERCRVKLPRLALLRHAAASPHVCCWGKTWLRSGPRSVRVCTRPNTEGEFELKTSPKDTLVGTCVVVAIVDRFHVRLHRCGVIDESLGNFSRCPDLAMVLRKVRVM